MAAFFSKLYKSKQQKSLEFIKELTEQYPYAPYTLKFLENPIPISFDYRSLSRTTATAALRVSLKDGEPENIVFSEDIYKENKYAIASSVEHETTHLDQFRTWGKQYGTTGLAPRSAVSFGILKELEAYGNQSYKLFVDAQSGAITSEEVKRHIETNGGTPLIIFAEAYSGQIIDKTEQADAAILDMVSQPIKNKKDVFPSYYYHMVRHPLLIDRLAENEMNNIEKALKWKEKDTRRKATETPFSQKFDWNDAKSFLERSSTGLLDVWDKKTENVFWERMLSRSEKVERLLKQLEA